MEGDKIAYHCVKCGYYRKAKPLYIREYSDDGRNGKYKPWIRDGKRMGVCSNCGVMPIV